MHDRTVQMAFIQAGTTSRASKFLKAFQVLFLPYEEGNCLHCSQDGWCKMTGRGWTFIYLYPT